MPFPALPDPVGLARPRSSPWPAYGNRNFFRLYSQWFGTPNGRSATHYPVAALAGKAPANPFTDVTPTSSIFFVEIS